MPRRRSGERTPKQLARELEKQRATYPNLFPPPPQPGDPRILAPASTLPPRPAAPPLRGGGTPCRLHGVPWMSCTQCSRPRSP